MLGFKTKNDIQIENLQYRVVRLEEKLKELEDIIKLRSLKQKRVNVWQSPEDRT